MPHHKVFGGFWYKRIACYRSKVSAERYAKRLRGSSSVVYKDIQVDKSDGWWCVYGRGI